MMLLSIQTSKLVWDHEMIACYKTKLMKVSCVLFVVGGLVEG
jgi:hypothetical protein